MSAGKHDAQGNTTRTFRNTSNKNHQCAHEDPGAPPALLDKAAASLQAQLDELKKSLLRGSRRFLWRDGLGLNYPKEKGSETKPGARGIQRLSLIEFLQRRSANGTNIRHARSRANSIPHDFACDQCADPHGWPRIPHGNHSKAVSRKSCGVKTCGASYGGDLNSVEHHRSGTEPEFRPKATKRHAAEEESVISRAPHAV